MERLGKYILVNLSEEEHGDEIQVDARGGGIWEGKKRKRGIQPIGHDYIMVLEGRKEGAWKEKKIKQIIYLFMSSYQQESL